MKKETFKVLCFAGLVFCAYSCTMNQGQPKVTEQKMEVLPQYRQEVSSIYKKCLQQAHGNMIQCMQREVNQLGEDVVVLSESKDSEREDDWQVPKEFYYKRNDVPVNEANLAKGAEIFSNFCSVCHGPNGEGRKIEDGLGKQIPSLRTWRVSSKTDGELFWKITEGSWPMPTFWEGDMLNEEDIWHLLMYIRSFSEVK